MSQSDLLTELATLIADLGKNGGVVSPSVYDTAQVIWRMPSGEAIPPALDWLMSQQQADGGWSNPAAKRSRDIPTLAALLAVKKHGTGRRADEQLRAGLAFLVNNSREWEGAMPDDLPVGAELTLPYLVDEAAKVGLGLNPAPYAGIIEMGARRRKKLASMQIRGGSTHAHSWEAFGDVPSISLIDGVMSVSHNPAATAAWLDATRHRSELQDVRERAEKYLVDASASTGMGIPGVVPGVWPIVRFEQAFGLYSLCVFDLLHHPALEQKVRQQLADVRAAMRAEGIGLSDFFAPDGDDTAVVMATSAAFSEPMDVAPLMKFRSDDHFCAYPGELHPSLSLTAHCTHALSLLGHDARVFLDYIMKRQQPDGRWVNDKWHSSWLYTTSRAAIALSAGSTCDAAALVRMRQALLSAQNDDGGWGVCGSTTEETCYGLLALRACRRGGLSPEEADVRARRARAWLAANVERPSHPSLWIGKELYCPVRIVRAFELAACISE